MAGFVTEIALHNHPGISWVAWRSGRNFGAVHLTRDGEKTLCGPAIPTTGRVDRNQFSAALEDLCRSCLATFAKEAKPNG